MASDWQPAGSRSIRIGDVSGTMFSLYWRNALQFIVCMVVSLIPAALVQALVQMLVSETEIGSVRTEGYFVRGDVVGGLGALAIEIALAAGREVLVGLATTWIYAISYATITLLTAWGLRGRLLDVGAAHREAFRRLPAVAVQATVTYAVFTVLMHTGIGFPFALYLALGWTASLPILLLEGRGTFESLRASAALVRGNRWRILACSVLALLPGTVLLGLFLILPLPGVSVAEHIRSALAGLVPPGYAATLAPVIVGSVLWSLFGALPSIGATVVYDRLRQVQADLGDAPAR